MEFACNDISSLAAGFYNPNHAAAAICALFPCCWGWGGAAGATAIVDPEAGLALFYAEHLLNPHEEFYQPRLRNVLYACL